MYTPPQYNWTDPNYKLEYKNLRSNPALIGSLGCHPKMNFTVLVDMLLAA